MFKAPVLAVLLLVTAVCRPASAFEWLDRMLGVDLDGTNTANYQAAPAGYAYQAPQPTALPEGYAYTALQPVPQPLPPGAIVPQPVPGQAVAPLPQTAPVYPYSQPYYQQSTGNAFTNGIRDCCDGIKNGCRRFCECLCPPAQPTAAVVAPIAYAPQPSQPVVPVPLVPMPIAPVPNPYAQAQPPMIPYSAPQAIAPTVPMEPSCQAMVEPSCAAGVETTCEASCMAMPVQQMAMRQTYPVAVYAAPSGFWQCLCECFCPPKQPAYYASYPQAVAPQAAYYQPQMQPQAQAYAPTGETYSNVQWTDEIVPSETSEGIQLQEAAPGDATLQPALPPAPIPPTGA